MTAGARIAAVAVAALLAAEPSFPEEPAEEAARWAWLDAPSLPGGPVLSPALDEAERALVGRATSSVLLFAESQPDATPADDATIGAGFVLREDGLVVTTWRILERARRGRWLWARPFGGRWQRVIPIGATWWCDAGVARLVTLQRRWTPVRWADAGREALGERFLAVGAPRGRPFVASAARLGSIGFLDPTARGGTYDLPRGKRTGPGKGAEPLWLRFASDLSTRGGSGSPVFDASGGCVGMAVAADPGRGGDERILVRPSSLLRRFLDPIVAEATFDPPDLGVRFGPAPVPPGGVVTLPEDLARLRDRESGGAIVEGVTPEGPANRILWEGDLVLSIEGRLLFGEVPESIGLALAALPLGVPAEVIVFRGGRRQSLQVTPRRGAELFENLAAEHVARAGRLLREAPGL